MAKTRQEVMMEWIEKNFDTRYISVTWAGGVAMLDDGKDIMPVCFRGGVLYAGDRPVYSIPSLMEV